MRRKLRARAQLATALCCHHRPRPRLDHGGKDAEERAKSATKSGLRAPEQHRSHAQNRAQKPELGSNFVS